MILVKRSFLYHISFGKFKKEGVIITRSIKEYDGSVTVEMALVFPIVVFVVVSIMMMSFYMSDLVCVRTKIYEFGILYGKENTTEEELKIKLQKDLKNQMIVANLKSVRVKRMDHKMKMSVSIGYDFKYFVIKKQDTINADIVSENSKEYLIRQKVIIDAVKDIK